MGDGGRRAPGLEIQGLASIWHIGSRCEIIEGFPAQEMCCKETLGEVCYLDVPDDLAVSLSDKLDLHLREGRKRRVIQRSRRMKRAARMRLMRR